MKNYNFLDVENILANLGNNDAYDIKSWYENYVCGGSEFERMADALFEINEREFLWHVADFISDEFDEEGLTDVIKEECWEFDIPMRYECLYDIANSGCGCGFINCTIQFKDSDKEEDVVIAVGVTHEEIEAENSIYVYDDEDIFFYVENPDNVESLFNEDNGEDFRIVKYDGFEE